MLHRRSELYAPYRIVGDGRQVGTCPSIFFADQLTLSEPGEQIVPIVLLRATLPPHFQTFRRPRYLVINIMY